jgi:hypothetical protein
MHRTYYERQHLFHRPVSKIAMFPFQVLANAAGLRSVDSGEFCRAVGVPATYAAEFRKMLALARQMREQGVRLT